MKYKKLKYKISSIVVFCICIILLFGACMPQNRLNNYDYLDSALNVTECLDDNSIKYIYENIENYYVNDNGNEYFSELKLSLTDNPYSVYYLFYDYMLLEGLKEEGGLFIESNMKYLNSAVKNACANKEIVVLDLVSYLCLQYAFYGTYDTELMAYLENNYCDTETSLFYELSNDSIENKVSFTIDVCNMFKMVELDYDITRIKQSIESYYKSSSLIVPNDDMSIFGAGGDALYAMDAIGNDIEITRELMTWYEGWKEYYSYEEIVSWEDVLILECVFQPVANALNEQLEFVYIDDFVSENANIDSLINDFYEERLVYDLLKNHLNYLTTDSKELLCAHAEKLALQHMESIKCMSIEASYYGMVLSSLTQRTLCNYDAVRQSVAQYYTNKALEYVNEEAEISLEKMINDTYYYSLLEFEYCEGAYSKETKNVIGQVLKEINKRINVIADPVSLRKLCTIISQLKNNFSNSEKKEIKKLFENYIGDEIIMSSYYIIDLYIIDKIMGFDEISNELIKSSIKILESDCCYYDYIENGGRINLESTFYMYALMALTGEIGNIYENSNAVREEVERLFKTDYGYTPYIDWGAPSLKTLYWGVCLSNI